MRDASFCLAPGIARHAIELRLEARDLVGELVLALEDALQALAPSRTFAFRAQFFDFGLYPCLLRGDAVYLLHRVLEVALEPHRAVLVEQPPRVFQLVERRQPFGESTVITARARAPHRVRGLLEPSGGILQVGQRVLTGETLELSGELFGLLGELALIGSGTTAALVPQTVGLASQPLVLLLLASRKLLQTLKRFVDFVVNALLLPALNGLVLVSELVELELEQVGEVFGARRLPAAATTAALKRHLHFAKHRVGSLEVPESALLVRHRLVRVLHGQLLIRRPHLVDGLFERLADGRELAVDAGDAAIGHTPQQVLHLLRAAGPASARWW